MVMKKDQVSPDKITAKAASMTNLVAYQDGSIVSRTIIDKDTGTVTLFAFDTGQGLSEHTAPFDAMVFVIDGEVELTIAGKKLVLKQGEITIIPACKPHTVKAPGRLKMLLIMIRS